MALPVWRSDQAGRLVVGWGAAESATEVPGELLGVLDAAGATGKAGEVVTHFVSSPDGVRRLLLVGVGDRSGEAFRRAGAAMARAARGAATLVTSIVAAEPEAAVEPFVAGATLGVFHLAWNGAGASPEKAAEKAPAATVVLAGLGEEYEPVLARATAIARAAWQARFLATVPSHLKSPAWLADQAVAAAERSGLAVTVWDEQELAQGGFGGIVAVGQGSATPPRLVQLEYAPAKAGRKTPHVVLVGKGITFDSGGLNIKPGASMATMKRDMTGAGVVLAVLAALAQVDCPVRVTGVLALAENAVSGSAMRPGDVVRHYGGRTSEVTNTDAEGRLVLADALAYAVDRLKPDLLLDIATLTGAVKVALGQSLAGLYVTSDAVAGGLADAAARSGEAVWRLPLAEVYEEKLASTIADADNAPGGPGSITAALFLRHFTGGLPWAHLDIASVGDAAADEYEWTPGPTGFGARLLLTWLSQAPSF